jgi:hypothetical protein
MAEPVEPCCGACRFWSPEYKPSAYVYEQESRGLPIFNSADRGWCTHGGRKSGENIDRDGIAGTYWESKSTGLETQHDTCCTEFAVRS